MASLRESPPGVLLPRGPLPRWLLIATSTSAACHHLCGGSSGCHPVQGLRKCGVFRFRSVGAGVGGGVASRPHPCPRVILLPLPPPGRLVWVPFAGAFFPRLRWHKVPVGDLAPLFLPRAPACPAAPIRTPAALLHAGFSGWQPQRLPSRGCGGHRSALVITRPSHCLGLSLVPLLLLAPLALISARAYLRVSTDAASTPVRLS
jgi:hypothetical protein